MRINSRSSRSLAELTRQITPPTKNGHAPPPRRTMYTSHTHIRIFTYDSPSNHVLVLQSSVRWCPSSPSPLLSCLALISKQWPGDQKNTHRWPTKHFSKFFSDVPLCVWTRKALLGVDMTPHFCWGQLWEKEQDFITSLYQPRCWAHTRRW